MDNNTHSTPKPNFNTKRKQPETITTGLSPNRSRIRKLFETTVFDESSFAGFTDSDLKENPTFNTQDTQSTWDPNDTSHSAVLIPAKSVSPKIHEQMDVPTNTSSHDNTISYIEQSYDTIVAKTAITDSSRDKGSNWNIESTTDTSVKDTNLQSLILNTFDSAKFKNIIQESVNEVITSKIDPVDAKCKKNTSDIQELTVRVDMLEQVSRLNNLIVSGIPENVVGVLDLKQHFLELASFLQVSLNLHDIVAIFRLGRRQASITRKVLVKFMNKGARDEIYFNRIDLKRFDKAQIFISEDLTPGNAKLYYQVRQRVSLLKLFSCYTRNGTVYVKANRNSSPVKVTSVMELDANFPAITVDIP